MIIAHRRWRCSNLTDARGHPRFNGKRRNSSFGEERLQHSFSSSLSIISLTSAHHAHSILFFGAKRQELREKEISCGLIDHSTHAWLEVLTPRTRADPNIDIATRRQTLSTVSARSRCAFARCKKKKKKSRPDSGAARQIWKVCQLFPRFWFSEVVAMLGKELNFSKKDVADLLTTFFLCESNTFSSRIGPRTFLPGWKSLRLDLREVDRMTALIHYERQRWKKFNFFAKKPLPRSLLQRVQTLCMPSFIDLHTHATPGHVTSFACSWNTSDRSLAYCSHHGRRSTRVIDRDRGETWNTSGKQHAVACCTSRSTASTGSRSTGMQ